MAPHIFALHGELKNYFENKVCLMTEYEGSSSLLLDPYGDVIK